MSQELNHIYKVLTDNQNDQHNILPQEKELYEEMISFLQNRNYEDAGLALTILSMVNPDKKYRMALKALAHERQGLEQIATERGLSKQSPYFQNNIRMVTSKVRIDAATTEAERRRITAENVARKNEEQERLNKVDECVHEHLERALKMAESVSTYSEAVQMLMQISDYKVAANTLIAMEKSVETLSERGFSSNNMQEKYAILDDLAAIGDFGNAHHLSKQLEEQISIQAETIIESAYKYSSMDTLCDIEYAVAEVCELARRYDNAKPALEHLRKCRDNVLSRDKQNRKRRKILIATLAVINVIAIIIFIVVYTVVVPTRDYNAAVSQMNQGEYGAAMQSFKELGDFRDSRDWVAYINALLLYNDNYYHESARAFDALWGFNDSAEFARRAWYAHAVELLYKRNYQEAKQIFIRLGDFNDSAERAIRAEYYYAVTLFDNGNYQEVIQLFSELNDFRGSEAFFEQIKALLYRASIGLAAKNNYFEAIHGFILLGDYQDSTQRISTIWNTIGQNDIVDIGSRHTVGLRTDGTVVAVGNNNRGQLDVGDWYSIEAVAIGDEHTIGLRSDGTLVAVGSNRVGQLDFGGWRNIIAVATAQVRNAYTVGLRADGTVVAVGDNIFGRLNVGGWYNIVSVAVGGNHTVGLRSDGTVVAVGNNILGQLDVADWNNIVAIAAGNSHTVGLRADGTVVAVGWNNHGQLDVGDWNNIVAIAAGNQHTVGLRVDGTVVAVGFLGQLDVGDWYNIVAVAAGISNTVGLRLDGTVVAVGRNNHGQLDVGGWRDIGHPVG